MFMKQIMGWSVKIGWILVFVLGFRVEAEGISMVNPTLSVSERYTDNFFFTETDREGDFSTMIIPGIDFRHDGRDLVLSGRYAGSMEVHPRHPESNRYGQSLALGLVLPSSIQGLEIQITDRLTHAPGGLPAFSFDRPQAESAAPAPLPPAAENEGIESGRIDTLSNHASISLRVGWSRHVGSSVFYSHGLTRYRGAASLNSTAHQAGAAGSLRWSPATQSTLSYAFSVTNYEGTESAKTHSVSTGIDHQISPTLSAGGSGGVAFLDGGTSHVTLGLNLSKGFKTGTAAFRYSRGIGTGGGVASSSTLSDRVTAQATQSLARDLFANLRFAYGKNRSLTGPEMKVSTFEAGAGMSAVLLSWLVGQIDYAYTNQRSRGAGARSAERSLVSVMLTATAPPWRGR